VNFDGPKAFGDSEVSKLVTTRKKIAKRILSWRFRIWRATEANPYWFALPSVDRDRSRRSLRQAPRFWTRAIARASPGIRVSRFHFASLNEPRFGEQKTLRSGGSGGLVSHELSISLMRDRSHEPGVRNRMAGSHSIVRRGF